MSPSPWTPLKREQVKRKIDREARRTAARLGAKSVVVVAFFSEGEYLHMQDGGQAPMTLKQLYEHLLSAHTVVEQSGGSDVAVQ